MEEPKQRPAPYKRKGGPLRAFGGGDLFTMILGAGCTLLVCSVRVTRALTVSQRASTCRLRCSHASNTHCDCVTAHPCALTLPVLLHVCIVWSCFSVHLWLHDPAGRVRDVGAGGPRVLDHALRDSGMACVRSATLRQRRNYETYEVRLRSQSVMQAGNLEASPVEISVDAAADCTTVPRICHIERHCAHT